jgi:cyclopropane-fatty-acyl-phospholipid synthase
MNRPLRDQVVRGAIAAAERGWIPDPLIRAGIRAICRRRAKSTTDDPELLAEATQDFLTDMSASPIAEAPELANAQHYEVPPDFFLNVLGPALKYSCCYWPSDRQTTLAEAEGEALRRTCDNALLVDGQRVLELGCGWGSLTLHMAANYPRSQVLAISNSVAQREFIQETARARGLSNVEVLTADINAFSPSGQFERIVSVEMFEHVRDHARLLERISHWLSPEGRLLVHVFCGAGPPYPYEDKGADDWMARNFFSGGVMPSDDLLLRYQRDLLVERQWRWSGEHYHKTLEAWLARLDQNRPQALATLSAAGERDAPQAVQRWRLFLMACSELFGYDHGRRWWVSHYRFRQRERL